MHENVIPAGSVPSISLPSATANASMLSVPMERTDVRPFAEDR